MGLGLGECMRQGNKKDEGGHKENRACKNQ